MNTSWVVLILTAVFLPVYSSPAGAQALTGKLDPLAAAATRDTVAGLFLVELGSLPLSSSSGGFVYRLNSTLGVVARASDGFGPFFTDQTLQNGRGMTSFGISHQYSAFSSLQGASLRDGTFPTNAARLTGATQPFSVDTLTLRIHGRTTMFFVSHGVTNRLTVGAAAPIVTVTFTGERMRTANGVSTLQSTQSGSATGLGDVAANARYMFKGNGNAAFR